MAWASKLPYFLFMHSDAETTPGMIMSHLLRCMDVGRPGHLHDDRCAVYRKL